MTHDYNTYKEIFQQPRVWLKTLDYIRANKDEIRAFTDKYLQEGYEIVLTGAGTSAYIGDALEPALYTTGFKGAKAIATTDIITNPEMYFDRDSKVLLVSFARSGNSPERVGAIKTLEKTLPHKAFPPEGARTETASNRSLKATERKFTGEPGLSLEEVCIVVIAVLVTNLDLPGRTVSKIVVQVVLDPDGRRRVFPFRELVDIEEITCTKKVIHGLVVLGPVLFEI